MSGEKVNKGEVLLFHAMLDKTFETDVNLYRAHRGIPEGGFTKKRDAEKWVRSKSKRSHPRITESDYEMKVAILKRHAPPTPEMIKLLDSYILLGSQYDKRVVPAYGPSFSIELPSNKEREEARHSFVKLLIYDTASKDDMHAYVEERGNFIADILQLFSDVPIRRIKSVKDKKRTALILSLARLPMQTLLRLSEMMEVKVPVFPKIYRHQLITGILEKRGYEITSRTSYAIKRMIERYTKKSKELKKVRRYT
ncbi:MAG: hypothetical protein A2756_00095 [Candidatus Ryanbacteria bacterium RIFCSPHIGHO2_01_FULL_48_27]|uniref:Uncharacterized protein n=1 Tax=Candidatus Ryanbacteria bacterium RIFCSPHIGHO2_01_FULL_48_27 TaxID=1802115 RepID=A0A1G2G1J5_9BACT|nr:MAG: hypothetical protein A2756_00095 [Candidatus Ryanbacteria bacterium RIFCSPHIGHO2_01_FULL_48_27]